MIDAAALFATWDEAMSHGDAATAAGLSPEDVEYVDHRGLGWSELQGRAALEAWYRTMMESTEVLTLRSELLGTGGDQVLVRQTGTFRALERDGGGAGQMVALALVTVRNGAFARIDIFDDENAARAAARQPLD